MAETEVKVNDEVKVQDNDETVSKLEAELDSADKTEVKGKLDSTDNKEAKTQLDSTDNKEVEAEPDSTDSKKIEPKLDSTGIKEADAKLDSTNNKLGAENDSTGGNDVAKNIEDGDISELEQKIIRQVEYYFGDYNLPKDKFLQEHIKKDEGWVPMQTMLSFQRLKSLSEDKEVICNALLKSPARLMQVSKDKSKIRRSADKPLPELSEARRKEIIGRSVYVKGFPLEGTQLDMLLEFLAPHGPTDNVQMRNAYDKVEGKWNFEGSIYVTFPTKEEAEEFLQKDSVKYKDAELIRKWQSDFLQERKMEMKEGKRGKEKRKQNLKDAAEDDKDTAENGAGENGAESKGRDRTPKRKEERVLGAVIVLKGLKETTHWTNIKDKLIELGSEVAFVDFSPGDPEAYARLTRADSAKEVLSKMEGGKMEIDGVEVEARVLEGEEETKYLDDQQESRKNFRNQLKRRGSYRGRGRGRGGKRGRN